MNVYSLPIKSSLKTEFKVDRLRVLPIFATLKIATICYEETEKLKFIKCWSNLYSIYAGTPFLVLLDSLYAGESMHILEENKSFPCSTEAAEIHFSSDH